MVGSADGRKEKLGEGIKMSEMVQDKRKEERETPREKKDFHLRVKLQINTDEPVLGPGVAELLELVEETGSMKEACGRMGMSYSKGWSLIRTAERELGDHGAGRAGARISSYPPQPRRADRRELLRHTGGTFSDKAVQSAGGESEGICQRNFQRYI